MGTIGAATRLLEEAAASPSMFEEKLREASHVLGFESFSVRHVGEEDGAVQTQPRINGDARAGSDVWGGGRLQTGRIHNGEALPDRRESLREDGDGAAWTPEFAVSVSAGHYAGWRYSVAGASWDLALVRSAPNGPVSAEEARALEAIMPPANRALHLVHHLADTHAKGLFEGLSASRSATILLDREGRARLVTPQASRLFGTDFGLRRGLVWSAHTATNIKLEETAAAARQSEPGVAPGAFPIVRINDRRPLLARPIRVRGRGPREGRDIRIALFLCGPAPSVMPDPADLKLLFGFSNAEVEIVQLLAEGLDPQEVAQRRNTTVGTVRVQMKHVFQKASVSRQSELIRLLADLRPPHTISQIEYTI